LTAAGTPRSVRLTMSASASPARSERAREFPRGRVCFHSEYAYPLIARRVIEFAGGAEALVVRLARGLARRGYDVCLTTCDFGQPAREVIDSVEIIRTFRPHHGIRGLRFVHPRLSRSVAGLLDAAAEAYYVCGSGMAAGVAHDVAKWRGAGFVLAMMTDHDVMRDPPPNVGAEHRGWYRRALRGADHRFAQTVFQQTELRRNFGVESTILPNIVDIPADPVDPGQEGIVLWLATYKPAKRPEWFIRLARELPRHRFVMAGVVPPPPLTRESWELAVAAAHELPNLEVNGFLPDDELEALRRRAALVVHTSPLEGFSNVLLEAWAMGLPTVSGVDPDGLVMREGIGAFAPDYATLVASVSRYMSDPGARREAGARARRYAEANHAPDLVLDAVAGALDPLIVAARSRRAGR
jgi:glycosyltransferase involved in cell wall biosynthesis